MLNRETMHRSRAVSKRNMENTLQELAESQQDREAYKSLYLLLGYVLKKPKSEELLTDISVPNKLH
jgi:hypothetical protein